MYHPSRHLWQVVALGAILVGPITSRADDDEVDAPVQSVQRFAVDTEVPNIDRWLFQENVDNGRMKITIKSASARDLMNSSISYKLDEIVLACDLSEAQLQKLSLAAQVDIARFFDRVEEVRRKYLAAKNDQQRMNEVWAEINSLRQQFSCGLFGEKSLFAKTLRRTLTEEQQADYRAMLLDQRVSRYKTAIEQTLSKPEDGIVLSREQIEVLQKLLLEQTQPPLLFGQDDRYVVMLRLSQLPRATLREVLDKKQWKAIQLQLLLNSGNEDTLVQKGVIEETKPSAPVIVRSVRTVVDGPVSTQADGVKPE